MKKIILLFSPLFNMEKSIFVVVLIFSVMFCSNGYIIAGNTVYYNQQKGNYFAFFSDGGDTFDQNSYQLGMWAHLTNKQAVAWRYFTTDGGSGSINQRPLKVGDVFTISVSCTGAYGQIGLSLLASPSAHATYADNVNNAAIVINNDQYGAWYAKYGNGSGSLTATSTGTANIYTNSSNIWGNYTFTITITAPDRANVSISNGTTTSYLYDLLLNNANPITEFAVYLSDDWNGSKNENIYWCTSSSSDVDNVTNGGSLSIGNSNSDFTESSIIPDGYQANSTSVSSLNSFTKYGTGTITLTGANTYTGDTKIEGGLLVLNHIGGNTISTSNNVYVNSGTLKVSTDQTIANLDLSGGGNLTIDAGVTLTITGAYTGGNGTINNLGTIVLQGAATQTFPGTSTVINNGTANAMTNLTIDNSNGVTLDRSFTVSGVLLINSGKTLNINPAIGLQANNSFTNNGTLNLLSDKIGTATILTPTTIGGSGTNNVYQYLSSARNWYMSSPVVDATAPSGNTYYKYVEAGNNGTTWTTVNAGDIFANMTGYIVTPSAASTIMFTGALKTGDQSIGGLTSTASAKIGFNLVGNPYPSFVNWSTATKTNLETTMWYRTKVNGLYDFYTYNSTGGIGVPDSVTSYIPPMQSFWVRVNAGTTGTLLFTNNDRSSANVSTNHLRVKALNSQPIMRLQVSNGINVDETVIYTNQNASNFFDDYDSPKMLNDNPAFSEIYTVVGNENLVINGMQQIPLNTEIPLYFVQGNQTSFTLKATEFSNFDSTMRVILKDKLNGNLETDITDGTAYSFNAIPNASTDRFSVIFRTSSVISGVQNPDAPQFSVISLPNHQLKLQFNRSLSGEVVLYNAVGQQMIHQNLNGTSAVLGTSLSTGVYFLNLYADGKSISRKVIVE